MNKKEANTRIEAIKVEITTLRTEAEGLADKYDIEFSLDMPYGMGGWYKPKYSGMSKEDALALLQNTTCEELTMEQRLQIAEALERDEDEDSEETGWCASSQSC